MSLEQLDTIAAVALLLTGTQALAFSLATTKQARYQWVQKTLVKHQYLLLSKAGKGVISPYLMKDTIYAHAQIKRLIQQYGKTGSVKVKSTRRNGFKRTYIEPDIHLLAAMDEWHGLPSDAVLKKLCERAHQRLGQSKYQLLAGTSISRINHLFL